MNITPDLKDDIAGTPLTEYLDREEELDILIMHSRIVPFFPGQIILQQGKKSPGMYVILEGTAIVTAKILGEGGTYITTLGKGNLMGEISLLEGGPSATSVIASTHVRTLLITHIFFDLLSVIFPQIKFKLNKMIAMQIGNRLMEVHRKILSSMSHSHMIARPILGQVIKSFNKPTVIQFEENEINSDEFFNTAFTNIFTTEEQRALLEHSTLIKAPNHCPILSEDQVNTHCYVMIRGAVQSSIVEKNTFAKLSVLGPLSLFCSISCIKETTPSLVNYTTCERAVLLKCPTTTWMKNNNLEIWYKLFNRIAISFAVLERSAEKLNIRLNSELYNR